MKKFIILLLLIFFISLFLFFSAPIISLEGDQYINESKEDLVLKQETLTFFNFAKYTLVEI